MGFARTVVAVMFLCVLGFYLSSIGELTDEAKWGSVALMGILAFGWINLGTAESGRQMAASIILLSVIECHGEGIFRYGD